MKLARLKTGDETRLGLIGPAGFKPVDVGAPAAPNAMIDLIERWDDVAPDLARAEADARGWLPCDQADLRAPIERPGKIFAIGLNYLDHIEEMNLPRPAHQLWFSKQPGSANGPFATVDIPRASSQIDYEVELVAVIGRRGRHISEADAPGHVFGYCVGNDVSVRDWQMLTGQWTLGKSFDGHAPFGPWITTADEVGDPHRHAIRCLVNGELRQDSNTRFLCFDIWQQIAYISQAMTLEPGDLIFTGTPGGVGMAMDPPRYLKAGDTVRCEIEGLGAIENRFSPEA